MKYTGYDLNLEKIVKIEITDEKKRYLDFASGIAVSCLGHSNPILLKALKSQSEKLWHTSNLYNIKEQERLAQELCN